MKMHYNYSIYQNCKFPTILTGLSVIEVLLTLLFAFSLYADTYYVAPNGNDRFSGKVSNAGFLPDGCVKNGSSSECHDGPWQTIQKAADSVSPGDSVIVKAGVYREFLRIKKSGTDANPIVFTGERGPTGEWLTVIDPGTPITGNWSEIGNGIYKQNIGFQPFELTVDGKTISRITNQNMKDGTGYQYLALPKDAIYPESAPQKPKWGTIRWWDGLEAMYGYDESNGETYIRLRNGDNPNLKDIKVTPNKNYPISPLQPAVMIKLHDYVVVENFRVQGGYYGIAIALGSHNKVRHNYVLGGFCGIGIEGKDSRNNLIENNKITYNYYGYDDFGAWQYGSKADYHIGVKESLYRRHKFLFRMPQRIRIAAAGNFNKIQGNEVFGGMMGVWIFGGNPTRDTEIVNNQIKNLSGFGITISDGHTDTQITKNFISNCDVNLRWHHFNKKGQTERIVYIYNNKLLLPKGVGKHSHIHWYKDGGDAKPHFWFYNNSLSGGKFGIYNARHSDHETLPNVYFINNIFSTDYAIYCQHNAKKFYSYKNAIGVFDYNWVGPTGEFVKAAWFGSQNRISSQYFWKYPITDFSIPLTKRDQVLSKGFNLSKAFQFCGKSYGPLPGGKEISHNGIQHIGALQRLASESVQN